jgi:hypothetical protein
MGEAVSDIERWAICVCEECSRAVASCACDPCDWREGEPPSRIVEVVPASQLAGAVSDEAVERAARVLFADYVAQYETTWERDGEAFMDQARRALAAAFGDQS